MITIQKFYFSYREAKNAITASSDGTDYSLNFVPSGDNEVGIEITIRGKKDFEKLVNLISELGKGPRIKD